MAKNEFSFRKKAALLVFMVMNVGFGAHAQEWRTEKRVNVLFGLNQLALQGFNIEGNYIHNRLIVDYSHGVSLDFKDGFTNDDLKEQGVVVHVPWTTGLGIGYRFTNWINVRVEPKWHRFEFYYENDSQNKSNQITAYNTFSLGIGVYGSYQPFKKKDNFLKGLMIAPSVRYWPTLNSTQSDSFTYSNRNISSTKEITTLDPGIGFTPLIINVSIGYSFEL